jgi:hypothetical protein
VTLSSHLHLLIKMQICRVLDEDPHNAVGPNEPDIGPRCRCRPKTEAHDKHRQNLRPEDGREQHLGRIGFGQKRAFCSDDEQGEVACYFSSRLTLALRASWFFSASRALEAWYSCQKPVRALKSSMTRMITRSVQCCTMTERTAAASIIHGIGPQK